MIFCVLPPGRIADDVTINEVGKFALLFATGTDRGFRLSVNESTVSVFCPKPVCPDITVVSMANERGPVWTTAHPEPPNPPHRD